MGESFSCQMFLSTWSLTQWLKRKGAWESQRKTKGKIDLEKVSPFHFRGLVGFLDVRQCLSRMLSDYSMAPTAVEDINTIWLTDKDRSCTKF